MRKIAQMVSLSFHTLFTFTQTIVLWFIIAYGINIIHTYIARRYFENCTGTSMGSMECLALYDIIGILLQWSKFMWCKFIFFFTGSLAFIVNLINYVNPPVNNGNVNVKQN